MDLTITETRAEDRAAIHALLHRYAWAAREKLNFADLLPLFTADATVVLPNGTEVPAASLGEVLQGEEAHYIRHHVTTIDLSFSSAEQARSETFFFAITNEACPDHWGCWTDDMRCISDGTWRISQRWIVVDGATPGGWFARMYSTAESTA